MPPEPLELPEEPGGTLPLYAYGGSEATRQAPVAASLRPPPLTSPSGTPLPRVSVEWLLQLSQRTPSECLVDTVRTQLGDPLTISDRGSDAEPDTARSCDSSRQGSRVEPFGPLLSPSAAGIDAIISHVMGGALGEAVARSAGHDNEPAGSEAAFSVHESEDSGPGDEETVSVFDASEAATPRREPHLTTPTQAQLQQGWHGGMVDLRGTTASSPSRARGLAPQGDVESAVAVSVLRRLSLLDVLVNETLEGSARRILNAGMDAAMGQRLTDEEIQALPTVSFQSEELQRCAVCLETYQAGELLTALHCGHFFHVGCLAQWVRRATDCPLCRTPCTENQ